MQTPGIVEKETARLQGLYKWLDIQNKQPDWQELEKGQTTRLPGFVEKETTSPQGLLKGLDITDFKNGAI